MTQQPHVSARAVTPAATPMVQPLFSPPASSATLGVFGRGSCPSRAPTLSSAGWALQRRLGDARRGLFLRPDWWERPRIERDLMKPPARPSPSSLAERGRWRGSGDPLQHTALTRSASLLWFLWSVMGSSAALAAPLGRAGRLTVFALALDGRPGGPPGRQEM